MNRSCSFLGAVFCLVMLGLVPRARAAGPEEPAAAAQPSTAAAWQQHWAFQPVHKPAPPAVHNTAWAQTAIDRFVLAKLEAAGMTPAEPADRRTLVRRATFDLTGLPPSPEEVEDFVNDAAPDAFARVVNRLLASPHYGERWGRYWLDIARYADTKGYVFNEDRRYPYAYTYRDWVIRALNEDLPYDRFVVEQIAADQIALGDDKRPLAALGFLTVGRRFLNNIHDIVDDRIDVVSRGTMALTVGCARCHDHKYDPIPTEDYYSFYGVFRSVTEKQVPIEPASAEYEQELHAREQALADFVSGKHQELLTKLRGQVRDYLLAANSEKEHPSTREFMFVEVAGTLSPQVIGRWRSYIEQTRKDFHPVFGPWNALAALPQQEFAPRVPEMARRFAAGGGDEPRLNRMVAGLFAAHPPASLGELADQYGKLFAETERDWRGLREAAARSQSPALTGFPDPAREELRQVLYGDGTPTNISAGESEELFDKPALERLRVLQKAVAEWRTSPASPAHAMAVEDAPPRGNPHVFVRGNPNNHGSEVPRRFLRLIAGNERAPFTHGSGRLELAEAIASAQNPLTARVMVNRVWLGHVGAGLVRTPSDFGMRSEPPSHPELLDYLAAEFVESGWSLKKLHRGIMLSNVYQQASDDNVAERGKDPENRLLWRMNRRRLDFEAMRDGLLAVTGDWESRIGGAAFDLTAAPFSRRRTLYGMIDRQNLPGMLRAFDFASPDTHCPRRYTTTVPQQALYLMNSPFVIEQAKRLAGRLDVRAQNDPALRVQRLYRAVLGRGASPDEVRRALQFIDGAGDRLAGSGPQLGAWEEYAQVLLMTNEFMFVD